MKKLLFNRILRRERQQRGLSQKDLANKIGYEVTTVSRWERGLSLPQPYAQAQLCSLFQMSLEDLGLIEERTDNGKDFFISYSNNDREWAQWISWLLEIEGYTTILPYRDFPVGSPILSNTYEAIAEVHRIIIVLPASDSDNLSELSYVFEQNIISQKGKLLPVRVHNCEPPAPLAQIDYIDVVGEDEEVARELLLKGIGHKPSRSTTASSFPKASRSKDNVYDVALSYAWADRSNADALAEALDRRGVRVFYDQYEKATLWGVDLYSYLSDIYQNKARYCVLLLSQNYATNVWTNHERQAAQARAFREREEYILPVRLDNVEIPGMIQTVSYLSWPPETADTIADAIMIKLDKGSLPSLSNTPKMLESTTEIVDDKIPTGFRLIGRFEGHKLPINRIAWSPDGQMLASPSRDLTVRLWNLKTGKQSRTFDRMLANSVAWSPDGTQIVTGGTDGTLQVWNATNGDLIFTSRKDSNAIYALAWSPDGTQIVTGGTDGTLQVWNATNGDLIYIFRSHTDTVYAVAWSPNGRVLASASGDKTVITWDALTQKHIWTYYGHSSYVTSVAWTSDGQMLVSASGDHTIRVWDTRTKGLWRILEGHTDSIICISFSSDNSILASKSGDGTIRLWRSDVWEIVATLNEPSSNRWNASLSFHPKEPILATLNKGDMLIRIWDVDFTTLQDSKQTTTSIHYTNAKIVLVGETGVGKSCLIRALTSQPFAPSESTHGRHVITFENDELLLEDGRKEIRETLLWDLAGQPGYRLIHQLHLNKVAVALVVFDARNETDPFAGVDYWARSLSQVQRVQEDTALSMKKFLVAARIDRGGLAVTRDRINEQVHKLGLDGYFETSAKEGLGIEALIQTIQKAIIWEALPKVSSTKLFQHIKDFLSIQKKAGKILLTVDDLYYAFLKSVGAFDETEELRSQFETCIERMESQDLIRHLSLNYDGLAFKFVLLQPEILDSYASALINAVKVEPDGLGSIAEKKVRAGKFRISEDERLKDKEQEKWLLTLMVKDLLRYEIALLDKDDDDELYLVFPTQSTREYPDLPEPKGKAIIFDFEGAVQNIYATLVVRISRSNVFRLKQVWKNAITYVEAKNEDTYNLQGGEEYGIFLRNTGEGRGELTLYFGKLTNEYLQFQFDQYVHKHLRRWAMRESIHRRRIFLCPECEIPFDDLIVKERRKRGFEWIKCNVCEMQQISLLDGEERFKKLPLSLVQAMDRSADVQRELVANFISLPSVQDFVIGDKVKGDKVMEDNRSYNMSDISNSNISGVVQGDNSIAISKLNASGQQELAQTLKTLTEAVIASQHLSDEEKQDHVDVITEISEKAADANPNKTKLKRLSDGLVIALQAVPDIAKAVAAATPVLNQLHL